MWRWYGSRCSLAKEAVLTPRRRHFITFVVAVLGATFVTTALGAGTGASDISRRIAKLAASRVQLATAPVATAAPKVTQNADRHAPSAPGAVGVSSASATTITLTWSASRDNVGIAGYGAYLNGARVGTTSTRSYKFTSLACGTTYRLGVGAFDAAHNRSTIAAALAATSPCIHANPPSAPTGLHQTSWSSTGAGVAWTAATDNVGVAGYTVYRDGVPLTTTQGTTSWIGNLVCGSGHSISVETYDAAGNHSPRTTAVVNTTSCADTTAPSVPRNLSVSGSTTSTI